MQLSSTEESEAWWHWQAQKREKENETLAVTYFPRKKNRRGTIAVVRREGGMDFFCKNNRRSPSLART